MINRAPLRGAFIFCSRLAEGLGEEPGGSPRRRMRPATERSAAEADSPRRKGSREQARSSPPWAGEGRASRPERSSGRCDRCRRQPPAVRNPQGGGWGQFRRASATSDLCPRRGESGWANGSAAAARRREAVASAAPDPSPPTFRVRKVVFQIRKFLLIWEKATRGGGRALLNLPQWPPGFDTRSGHPGGQDHSYYRVCRSENIANDPV
jgi:hypothetical protein